MNGWTISTVWLGFDRDGENPDRPLIFETRAFGPEPDEYDNTVNLYATESDAVDGHARAVFAIRDGLSRKVVESSAQ